MPSAMSGLTARIHGRTALVVGAVVLAVSLTLWVFATGIAHPFMVDLDTYRLAARDAHHNQSLVYTKQYGSGSKGPFLYPPFALAILMQVDTLSLHALGWILSAISAAALLATVHVLLRRLNPGWDRQTAAGWTLLVAGLSLWLEPVTRTFMFGQVSLLLLALVVLDLALPDGNRFKGAGIGLAIAIKLTPAVFVLYLLGTRRFRAALTSIGVFAATVVIGYGLLPQASTRFWFHSLSGPTQINKYISIGDATDQSLKAMVFRALHGSSLLNPVYYLLALLILGGGLYAAVWLFKKGDDLAGMIVTAIAGLLVSPIAWTHHWVWILPALLVFGHRLATGALRGRLTTAAYVAGVLVFVAYPMKLDPSGKWALNSKIASWAPTSVTWTQPHQLGREFHWNVWNFLVGNLYVLAGVAFVGFLAWQAWSRRAEVSDSPSALVEGRAFLAPVWARLRTRAVLEPLAVALGAATVLFTRLNVPNQVGVADNYDGGRLLCHFSLVQRIKGSSVIQNYAWFEYVQRPGNTCEKSQYLQKDLPHPAYESSQLLLMRIAKELGRVVGLNSTLDLRTVGFVSCVFIGGAIGLLFAVLRTRRLFRYLLAAAIVLITIDASFIDFSVSPLSEISAIIGLLYLLPATVLIVRGGRARGWGMLLALAAGFFLTLSKAQMVILAVPIGVLLAAFPLAARIRAGKLGTLDLTGRVGRRVLPVAAAMLLLGGSIGLTPKQDAHYAVINKADFVFTSLLRTSPDPVGDLKALGIPASYADQIGKAAFCKPHSIGAVQYQFMFEGKLTTGYKSVGSLADTALAQGIARGTVTKFLLSHPDRAVRVMNDSAGDFFHVRPQFTVFCPSTPGKAALNQDLGNYAADSGKAPYSTDPIAPVTAVFQLFQGLGLIPLLILWLAPLAVVVRLATRSRRRATGDAKAMAVLTMLLGTTAIAQFIATAFGDGIDGAKHLNLSVYASAVAVVTAVGCAVLTRRAAQTVGDVPTDENASVADEAVAVAPDGETSPTEVLTRRTAEASAGPAAQEP